MFLVNADALREIEDSCHSLVILFWPLDMRFALPQALSTARSRFCSPCRLPLDALVTSHICDLDSVFREFSLLRGGALLEDFPVSNFLQFPEYLSADGLSCGEPCFVIFPCGLISYSLFSFKSLSIHH